MIRGKATRTTVTSDATIGHEAELWRIISTLIVGELRAKDAENSITRVT